ncbi:MAG TPA: CapA family protein [Thermomicrobiales bacterium]|jgi:poly-gamma-glutamate synthesis protein (capsule biosynthesis protein)
MHRSISPLTTRLRQHSDRRGFLFGAAGLGVAGLGAIAGASMLRGGDTPNVPATSVPDPTATTAPTDTTLAQQPPATPTGLTSARLQPAVQVVADLPAGMALVSSPRLPLFGVGGAEVAKLLGGQIPTWLEVGSPIDLPVEPIALDGQVPDAATPTATFTSYDELAAELARRPGAVALVPADQVDFRANVLAVDGYDPVRQPAKDADPVFRIGVVGDIVPGRNVHFKMVQYGDHTHPFLKVAAELNSYDLAFANLEGNLSSNIEPPTDAHTFSFVSTPDMLDGFKLAGFDAVSLANNHSTWNSAGWGTSALIDTMDSLDAAGVARFGAGHNLDEARGAWTTKLKGQRVAILGIDGVTANEQGRDQGATVQNTALGEGEYAGAGPDQPGTNPFTQDQFVADIESLSADYDVVIPYFHFGVEYVAVAPDWAVAGARAAIDAGATMVLTNHPHVIQGMEIYSGKPIVYSMGNFIFDQMFSVEVREGFILEIVLRGNKVVALRPRGVEIEDFNQPRFMSAGEHASLMDRFWTSTDRLANRR